jgi:antitoxin VapB
MHPRRKQPALTIRSARAVRRLKQLARDGRSQAAIIEEALDRMPDPGPPMDENHMATRMAELAAIIARIPKHDAWTMKEFDAVEYDEFGDLR